MPIPLELVLKACPDILDYAPEPPRHWRQFAEVAARVRAMMGITTPVWHEACQAMGEGRAAVTIAAMLQRFDKLRSPGGYLRALTRKAMEGAFSPGPMVMALLNADAPSPAAS